MPKTMPNNKKEDTKIGVKPRWKRRIAESCGTPRTSPRQAQKRKIEPTRDDNLNKRQRKCDKSWCTTQTPVCFANVTKGCAKNGYTSRWYHISDGEHFCNECFEYYYRTYKDGYSTFWEWKKQWSSNGKTEPSIKPFMADMILPFWVRCTRESCGKWRQLHNAKQLTSELISKYVCTTNTDKPKIKKNYCDCSSPEDSRVSLAKEKYWIETLNQPPYLRNSPSAQFLGAYYPDGIGLSPTCSTCIQAKKSFHKNCLVEESTNGIEQNRLHALRNSASDLHANFRPFYQPSEQGRALCFRPDVMEPEEMEEFKEYSKEPMMYLTIRNLIIALWNLNCRKWVVLEEIEKNLICRGLVRIRCMEEASRILTYLTCRGIINIGLISSPSNYTLIPPKYKGYIVVIGAGTSGIAAARQLQKFGFQVTILEARNRIGGRVWDDESLGTCIGRGAQIVTGVINNPFTLMCEQAGIKMRIIGEKCDLYNSLGVLSHPETDKQVDIHFNSLLEAVSDWRKTQDVDISLYDKLMENHNSFVKETRKGFSSEKLALFHFHISNLEYACGTNINNVSALHWDQNENYSQFAGDHALLPCGYSHILSELAEGLDVRLKVEVECIDYVEKRVKITTASGDKIYADKVVVTIPLAVLQKETLQFYPPLPEKKQNAIHSLGSGLIEKIAMQFPTRFWDSKLGDDDYFGYIPENQSVRGQFAIFYDMVPQNKRKKSGPHILMTYVSGDAVLLAEEKSDAELIVLCMNVLRRIFSDKDIDIPEPTKYFVTHWRKDAFAQMAYSYVKLGSSGEAYDDMAEDVDCKLYFAGEATNRHFPQTVTGAFMSGLREANKIYKHVKQAHDLMSTSQASQKSLCQ